MNRPPANDNKRHRPGGPARPVHRLSAGPRRPPRVGVAQPLNADEWAELQALLDTVPAPLAPLDTAVLDGFLCGVLVQPRPVAAARWLRHVTDEDGRALPAGFDATRLHALVLRRHAELDDAVEHRRWFDPQVYASDADDAADEEGGGDAGGVYPWVAGFATALELFPALIETGAAALDEPLALLYRHLDADDLEDADALLAQIDAIGPAEDLADAVEGLVRATLLLADLGRPLPR